MIRSSLVLGGGSAGLLAALTLRKKLPALDVEVIHSGRIGVIGVGEGTTPYVPSHLHNYLGFDEHEVFNAIRPVLKLGVRFKWGRRPHFDYTFSGRQHSWRRPDLPKNNGFYAWEDPTGMDLASALMDEGKALPRRADRLPDLPPPGSDIAWHIEIQLFVAWLESACRSAGVRFTDTDVTGVETSPEGIAAVQLDDGSRREADLYIDCSGFASELIGKALAEPFIDFGNSLLCDRAVADTMSSGWMWRIDHPDRIHRGYVYSSTHASDDEAVADYLKVAPKATHPRIVRFRSGHHRRCWIGNTVGIGNAAGFVEPLEATALMTIYLQCRWLADGLIDSERSPSPGMHDLYNHMNSRLWREIRDFLAIHYKLNDRLDTPFWRRCREEIPLNDAGPLVTFYRENGPSAIAAGWLSPQSPFGLDGYLAILCGLQVPHERQAARSPHETTLWQEQCRRHRRIARDGMGMRESAAKLADRAIWSRIRHKAPPISYARQEPPTITANTRPEPKGVH